MGAIIDISEALLDLGLSDSITDGERAIVNTAINRAESAIIRHLRYDPVRRTRTEYYPQQDFDMQSRTGIWEVSESQAYLRQESTSATSELQVQHVPIRSITNLWIDYDGRFGTQVGAFAAETLKVEGTDYWPSNDGIDNDGNEICRDGIIRSSGLWPISPGSVKMEYVAGYTAAEFHGQTTLVDATPIMDAVLNETVRKAKKIFITKKQAGVGFAAGPITGERMGDYSYTIDASSAKSMYGGLYDLSSETREMLEAFVNWGWMLAS